MVISIAIQAYFAQLRKLLTRQGFDASTKIVYGGDAEGPQKLLDQDMADKKMPKKSETDRDNVRKDPFTYLFWDRTSPQNIIRRSINLQDGNDGDTRNFKKTVSISFTLNCVFVSNKANLIEDFAEAFAAEYQNSHTVPVNLKYGYDDRRGIAQGGYDAGINITCIQELGEEELVSFRIGDLFSYRWNATLYLNVASEFATIPKERLRRVVVDLYNPEGVPLASLDADGKPEWKEEHFGDVTKVVPERAYVEHEA